ncbi:MAG: MFS transporter [Pseudomonadota bacterium]
MHSINDNIVRVRRGALAILVIAYACSMADRMILSILMGPIQAEFGLNDTQLGLLGGLVFAMFYATLGVPIARLADRKSRKWIIIVSLALFSLMTAASGLATSFLMLIIFRMLVGVGEAGVNPASQSIVADYYPVEKRSSAMGVLAAGANIGVIFGFLAGGVISQSFGWRPAFFFMGVPGLIIAIVAIFALSEPRRGLADGHTSETAETPNRTTLIDAARFMASNKALLHLTAAITITAALTYGVSSWLPLFFMRVHGLAELQVGLLLAGLFGVLSAISVLLGGYAGQRADQKRPGLGLRWVGIAQIIAIPLGVAAYLSPALPLTLVLMVPVTMLLNLFFGPTFARLHTLSPINMRATNTALLMLSINLIGYSLGPLLIGMLSDLLAAGSEGAMGLQKALAISMFLSGWGGFHYIMASRPTEKKGGTAMPDGPDPEDRSNPASMRNPVLPLRLLGGALLSRMINPQRQRERRARFEARRRRTKTLHTVEYFHQTDDPYSHLAVQTLANLRQRYDIDLQVHLIRATGGKNQPFKEDLAIWARRDAGLIAGPYGLHFPDKAPSVPSADILDAAERALASLSADQFVDAAPAISTAAWSSDREALLALPKSEAGEAEAKIKAGCARLKSLHHYSGATFYYHGEWYWGADRLDHLEQHLTENGAAVAPDDSVIVTRPAADVRGIDASDVTLHFYPSLNSPYTAIIFDHVIALRDACGVNLITKPVLPMIMRGVPATMDKARYIMLDAKREGERNGVPFGPILSPIGDPVRDAYSLLPWAKTKGRDEKLLSELLRRAFSQAAPLHTEAAFRCAVQAAGLDWQEAQAHRGSDEWRRVVAQNQEDMTKGMRLWGVPSFRVEGPGDEPPLDLWGQDRLWVVTEEIKRRVGARATTKRSIASLRN